MNIDYSEKYKNTLDKICSSVNDITLSFQGNSDATAQYRVIPFSKKGKEFIRFDAANMKTLETTSIFVSPQTVGVKLYDRNYDYQSDYSVSRKNGKQVIQIKFADGTGLKQIYELNPNINQYVLVDTTEVTKATDFINVNDYSDEIINSDLLLYNMYQQVNGTPVIRFLVAYGDKDKHTGHGSYYNLDEHPELSKISEYLINIHRDLIDNYVSSHDVLDSFQFSRKVAEFYKTFRASLKEIEQDQTGPDTPDSTPEDR